MSRDLVLCAYRLVPYRLSDRRPERSRQKCPEERGRGKQGAGHGWSPGVRRGGVCTTYATVRVALQLPCADFFSRRHPSSLDFERPVAGLPEPRDSLE